MSKQIYLVRHGQKEKGIGDPHLTEEGKRQAVATATFLAQFPVDLIMASPLRRTQETAQFIAQKKSQLFVTTPLLKERINWGDDPTQSFDEFLKIWQKATQNREWQPPVGDSSHQAGERLAVVVANVQGDQKHIVLVTHGDIISDFLRNIFDETVLLSHFQPQHGISALNIPECSITTIQIEGSKRTLLQLANCDHLI